MSTSAVINAATLISAISKLAWPLAVAGLVLAFRKPIAEQVTRLQAIKAGGAEFTFAQQVDDALRASARLAPHLVDEVSAARRNYLTKLASTDAKEAVHQGWRVVREAAQGVARRRQLTWSTTKDLVEYLEKERLLDRSAVELVLNLRSLRYDMADNPDQVITPTIATAYVSAASSVADLLSRIPGSEGDSG
jgi:hypothetical protein